MHTPGTVGACVCVCGREPNPRGTRPGGPGPLPPEGRKWFDFDITGHQRRKHRLGFCRSQRPGAAPRIWLRLCEGYRLDPTDSSYDAEFWLPPRRGSTLVAPGGQCRCAHAAYLHSVVPVGGGVLFLLGKGGWDGRQGEGHKAPKKRASASMSVSESSPLQGVPWQGTCAPCAQGFQGLGGAGALLGPCWGGGCFYSMVLEENQGRGAETRAAGRRRTLGGGDLWGDLATLTPSCSYVGCVSVPSPCLCARVLVILQELAGLVIIDNIRPAAPDCSCN